MGKNTHIPSPMHDNEGLRNRYFQKATLLPRLKQLLFVAFLFIVCVAALTREPVIDVVTSADFDRPVANREIRATFYFESVDLARTQEAKDQEIAKVPNYYRINQSIFQQQIALLRGKIEKIEGERLGVSAAILKALEASVKSQPVDAVVAKAVSAYVAGLKEQEAWQEFPEQDLLALWLTPDASGLPTRVFVQDQNDEDSDAPATARLFASESDLSFKKSDLMAELAVDGLEQILMTGVRAGGLLTAKAAEHIVIVRTQAVDDPASTTDLTLQEVPDPETAVVNMNKWLVGKAQPSTREGSSVDRWARIQEGALALAAPLVVPDLQEDVLSTETARIRAAETVQPVLKEIEAGEIIQDRGKRWTRQSRSDVQSYMDILSSEEHPVKKLMNTLTAHFILVLLVFWAIYKRMHFIKEKSPVSAQTAFNLALLLLTSTLLVGRFLSYFEPTGYVLPVAAAGILYAILAGPQRASFFGVLMTALVSAQYQYNWRLLLVAGAMTVAGIFTTDRVRKRSDMTAASLVATVVGILALGAAVLATDTLFTETFVRRIFMVLFNGFLCILTVPALLPWLERLFHITTDIQLLEYSDLNNPVLRQLAVTAPATFAHSLQLGQLAEVAADAVGANGLLARVCAYYHDIGKQFKPEMFTENQSTAQNIHDSLSPQVSARIIRQHVIDGVKLAKERNLPQPIINGILEHHGTCKISFFYEKALAEGNTDDIDENEFRYPGPRPQRPETAILMICDGSESGVRSLDQPDFEAVSQFVGKIIRARSEDNQFENCDLTLKQLTRIRDTIANALMSTMHRRIVYPDQTARPESDMTSLKTEGSSS
ncbi:MAG: HDIG domain-containing metalloprotein [Candidatus Hydrogenedentales bacterium]